MVSNKLLDFSWSLRGSIRNSSQILSNMAFLSFKIVSSENVLSVSTIRAFISATALLVKVIARIRLKGSGWLD